MWYAMANKMTFNELVSSILNDKDAAPEEVAMWLDLHGLANYKSITSMLNTIQCFYHTANDVCSSRIIVNLETLYASDIMLKNLFTVMFKLNALCNDDAKKLLKYADKQCKRLNAKCKKLKHEEVTANRVHKIVPYSVIDNFKRLSSLSDVFEELADRLKAVTSPLCDA